MRCLAAAALHHMQHVHFIGDSPERLNSLRLNLAQVWLGIGLLGVVVVLYIGCGMKTNAAMLLFTMKGDPVLKLHLVSSEWLTKHNTVPEGIQIFGLVTSMSISSWDIVTKPCRGKLFILSCVISGCVFLPSKFKPNETSGSKVKGHETHGFITKRSKTIIVGPHILI